MQQAPPAIILAALLRFGGPALFHGPRTSSRLGTPFWLSGLTLRSSGLAFSQPLTLAVSLHVIIQAMLYLSPLPPSCSSVGSGAFLGVCGFLVFLASSARSACASSFCFCSAVCLRSIFGLAAVANRSVKPTRLRRAAYFLSLGIMGEFFPAQVFKQLSHARAVIERHLAATLDTIHLFGSAIDGGLKPDSDIDLLVTVSAAPNDSLRQALMLDLLKVSSPPGDGGTWRPLELTVVARSEVVPWRYPARRELQFGEWLRHDILSGTFEPAVLDHDLAILLTKARQHSLALLGPSAATFFEPVPKEHFSKALFDTIAQWNAESDWKGDERNVVLALARIWYSASTGLIAPKDVAAAWVSERLPAEHRPLICKARAAYLGSEDDDLAMRVEETAAFVRYAKATIERILR